MLLQVDNLKTHFEGDAGQTAKAVEGVSFEIDCGQTVALVGESGCGKSVTAFSIMRLLPENALHPAGRILFDNADLLSKSEAEMQAVRGNTIAMIFQDPVSSLNPLKRIGDQLTEPLRIHRGMAVREARKEALSLMRHVGIPAPEDRLQDYPHQLSGGMCQRVMIAMALACRPELLIADEPTTALDVTIQAQMLALMKDLQKETNMAILFITHDLGVVNQIADDVCVMYAGRFMEKGSRSQIFRNMAHPYTRGLFASLPMAQERGRKLRVIPGSVPGASEYPAGCPFHDRCREKFDRCPREESPLHPVAPGQFAACHLLEPKTDYRRDEQAWEAHEQRPERQLEESETPPRNLIEVTGLKTFFPVKRGVFLRTVAHIRAVDQVSFAIPQGATLALVGESGCGKTTVGLSVLRLLREASGTVVFNSEDAMAWDKPRLRAMRKHLQIVFQDPFSSLSPRMTVGDIVEEGLRVHQKGLDAEARRQRVLDALAEVGLPANCRERYPHEFSGGQRQRISIARALILKPDFLVLDEPTSALDVSVQAQILNLLNELQARHRITFLFITHDLAVVQYMADHVAVMYLGKIVEYAASQELFKNPLHPYTRSLLKSIPRPEERHELTRLQGEVPSPLNPPPGCHFHPRCPVYGSAAPDSPLHGQCPMKYPELREYGTHAASCYAVESQMR